MDLSINLSEDRVGRIDTWNRWDVDATSISPSPTCEP